MTEIGQNLTCPDPNPINSLSIYGFVLKIAKIPNITFWVKECNIPGISLESPEQSTPFVNTPLVGDKLQFENLDIRFLLDEYMNNYESLYEWITLCGFPNNYGEVNKFRSKWFDCGSLEKDSDNGLVSDATLTIKTRNNENVRTFHIKKMIITSLGSISLTDDAQDTQYLYGTATFKFEQFTLGELLLD